MKEGRHIFHEFCGKLNSTEFVYFTSNQLIYTRVEIFFSQILWKTAFQNLWKIIFHNIYGKHNSRISMKNKILQNLWETRFHCSVNWKKEDTFSMNSVENWIPQNLWKLEFDLPDVDEFSLTHLSRSFKKEKHNILEQPNANVKDIFFGVYNFVWLFMIIAWCRFCPPHLSSH